MKGCDKLFIPNLSAETEPNTVTGISDKPSVINRPSDKFPPITSNNSELVTTVEIPPPSNSEIKSVLRTNKSACVVEVTSSTGPILSTIPITPSGNSSWLPKKPACGEALIKFVPRDSRVANKSALPDDEIPVTATIAAIPIPIPIDVIAALPLRAFTPYKATKNKSRNRNLFFTTHHFSINKFDNLFKHLCVFLIVSNHDDSFTFAV